MTDGMAPEQATEGHAEEWTGERHCQQNQVFDEDFAQRLVLGEVGDPTVPERVRALRDTNDAGSLR